MVGIVVAVLVAVLVGYYVESQALVTDQVTSVSIVSEDNACGLNGASTAGFVLAEGQSFQATFSIPTRASTECTVSTVTAVTPGFKAVASDLPLLVPVGTYAALAVTITMPSHPYSGVVTISVQ